MNSSRIELLWLVWDQSRSKYYLRTKFQDGIDKPQKCRNVSGLDINVCPIPVKTDVGQVDLVLRLSDGTSEKVRFLNVPVRWTNLFPLV